MHHPVNYKSKGIQNDMGRSQHLRAFVCGGVSYSQVRPYHTVFSLSVVSGV